MKKLFLVLVGVLVIVVGYWLVSPLFIDKRVSEAFPTESEGGESEVLFRGSFEGFDNIHYGSGGALILDIQDERVLRFEDNFNVANGPDLFVGFGKDGEYIKGSEISRLKGNIGSQNYVLPADFDINKYNEVWIWCKAFSVPFAKVKLIEV